MGLLGIISGTVFIDTACFGKSEVKNVENDFGHARILINDRVAFIPRHGQDAKDYILPHRINHAANLQALKDMGVREVIGINSTGSLKRHLQPGTIVVPHDYIMMYETPTIFRNKPVHITPIIHPEVRKQLIETAGACGELVTDGGIYWQTKGPRFETRAEIAMMANFADIVGMTMASEAIVSQELGLSYASLCSVDNFAHGLGETALTVDEIYRNARIAAEIMIRIINQYVGRRRA